MLKKRSKKGQFFILAAIIIASVVVSLAVTKNLVTLNKGPQSFYDLSAEFKEESAKVIDYSLYTNQDELEDFIELSLNNIADKDPSMEIFVLYGDESNLTFENYGTTEVNVIIGNENIKVAAANRELVNEITLYGEEIRKYVIQPMRIYRGDWRQNLDTKGNDYISVNINDKENKIRLTEGKQFYFVARKAVGEEVYVDVQ